LEELLRTPLREQTGTVYIEGGQVTARSNGKTAIGGGNSTSKTAGNSNITISGGIVKATAEDMAIGGGNSTNSTAGITNVTITGGTVNTTAIGSGKGKDGYQPSNVTIDGGSVNAIVSTQPKNSASEMVYLTQATVYESDETQKNTYISSLEGVDHYGLKDVQTDSIGRLYIWIPMGKTITGATDDAGILYTGSIEGNSSGILCHNCSNVKEYIIFDVSKAPVVIGATYSGKDPSGGDIYGTHQPGNEYYITQTDHSAKTTNTITFNQTSEEVYTVILDNVNMGAKSYTTVEPGTNPRCNNNTEGEININATTTKNISIKLRNENIVRTIRYYTGNNTKSKLKITSFDGDGSTKGKLYIPEKKEKQEDIDALVNGNTNYNRWNAGIGGHDDKGDVVRGITIAGGDIQVLTSEGDNCTAIGGGGNGLGEVTITGGKVKAIANGTGAAIGGGIGWNSPGGEGKVTITGGEVFVANYGAGVAIGGGSAKTARGSDGNVSIEGGHVTAIATEKTAIGGGNSENQTGGNANITIHGGTVKSTSIGSGYGINGYKTSNVTITGGSINSLISTQPTDGSKPVHLTKATIYESDKIQKNIDISSIEGIDHYGLKDVKTDENGTLYLWIPDGKEITGVTDSKGTPYTGSIPTKAIGILHHNSSKNYYSVRCSYNNNLTLYTDPELTFSFSGSLTAASETNVSFWVKTNKYDATNYYALTAYKSNTDKTMNILTPEPDSNASEGLYHYTLLLDTDKDVWFETRDGTTNRLSLDLLLGNVVLQDDAITVGGYTLSNYTGKYTLTSGGTSTENTITIKAGTYEMLADRLVVDTKNSAIRMEGGTLNLSSSSYENSIKSDIETIHLYNDSNLNIADIGGSLKLETSQSNTSSIAGEGNVNITKNGGFLTILTKGTASQITAKNYTYTVANDIANTVLPYSVTLSGRTMIGYTSEYSGTRKMYDKNDAHTASSGNIFKAIGVEYIGYTEGITITPSIHNNNAIFTLQDTPKVAYVENGGTTLEKDTDYTFTKSGTTGTLEIKGTSITDHLVIALADDKESEIAVDSMDKTCEYDGNPHSIEMKVIHPKEGATIQYSTDNSNWQEKIEYITPGEYTIYWKVSAEGFTEKTGSNKITITPATNYWTKAITIKSLRIGETPNPQAEAKWGTEDILYEYSTSPNGEFTSTIPTAIGGYYVRAKIKATDLYAGLTSNAIRFYIEPTAVYIKDAYTMDKLTTIEGITPSVTGAVSCDKNFSVLYNFLYIPDKDKGEYVTIHFGANLPVGTKIVLVDFSTGDTLVDAYYYKVETETNRITSNDFKRLGSNDANTFEKGTDGLVYSATYQILVQFPEGNTLPDNLTMSLSHDGETITASDITIDTTTAALSGNVKISNLVSEEGKVTADVYVTNTTTKANYKNVLAISLYKSDGKTPIVFSPSTIVKMGDKEADIRANIAALEGITNSTYPIEISGLQDGEYKIKASISAGNTEMLHTLFPMNYVKDDDTSSRFQVENPIYGIDAHIISGNDNDRVVNVSEEAKTVVMELDYTAQNITTNPTLTISIQKKEEDASNDTISFSNLSTEALQNWTITKPSLTIGADKTERVSITIPKGQENGAYLVRFELGNVVCEYCIVVDNEN